MSPSAITSGWPGRVRSPSTVSRPALSTSAPVSCPSSRARGFAVTPAAQITVLVGIVSVSPSFSAIVTESSSMLTTVRLSITVTPSPSSDRLALADSESGKLVSTRSRASTMITRAALESMKRKLPFSVSRASSAICPDISTPVGPAPTTTKVSSARRASGSLIISAASKARRRFERTEIALSSVLTSAAYCRHSSCPKYE